jgi:hypothetical protein
MDGVVEYDVRIDRGTKQIPYYNPSISNRSWIKVEIWSYVII